MNNYYHRVRDLREDHDYSQQFVAEYLDMKQPQYSRYERGLRDLPTDVLIRLARLYKTSTDYLLGLTDTATPYPNNK
ncbi:MAG: helix-turn-helix transcriptional regulator [Clostridia bacterium]|nr:helix-turn-helix transcriptional regulator [Clostridia bacterium]